MKPQQKHWHRLSARQREALVEAEVNRPLTGAELADLEAEVREATGEEEEIDEEAINASSPHHHRPTTLVWVNPRS